MDTARLAIVVVMDVISIPTNGRNRTRRTLSDSQTYASSFFISIFLYVYDHWFRVDVNPQYMQQRTPHNPTVPRHNGTYVVGDKTNMPPAHYGGAPAQDQSRFMPSDSRVNNNPDRV